MAASRAVERDALDVLWETLRTKGINKIGSDGHMVDLNGFKIIHETLKHRTGAFSKFANQNVAPDSLFQIPLSKISDHPLDPKFQKDWLPYLEYASMQKDPIFDRAHIVTNYVERCAFGFKRIGTVGLRYDLGVYPIEYPSPFYLDGPLVDGYYPNSVDSWSVMGILETMKKGKSGAYPHLVLQLCNPVDGKEDSILFSELRTLIVVMRGRARQRRIEDESEQEALLESSLSRSKDNFREKINQYDLEYADEKHFPVRMLSYVGPQHARYFTACMDGDTLLIKQSRLFDFRKQSDPDIATFTSLLLSQPSEIKLT